MVPYMIPTISFDSPSPPAATGSIRKGFIIFTRNASGSLYNNMNIMATATFFFRKKVANVLPNSRKISPAERPDDMLSEDGRGRLHV